MKKTILPMLLVLSMLLLIAACTNPTTNDNDTTEPTTQTEVTEVQTTTSNENGDFEPMPIVPLSEEMERRIKRDWFLTMTGRPSNPPSERDFDADNIRIDHYFGVYNGKVAIMISDIYTDFSQMVWEQEVAGFTFRYGDGQSINIWNNGEFLSLLQAYEQNILTTQDIRNIHYYHQAFTPLL